MKSNAFWAGVAAYGMGFSCEHNPYRAQSKAEWLWGWRHAEACNTPKPAPRSSESRPHFNFGPAVDATGKPIGAGTGRIDSFHGIC